MIEAAAEGDDALTEKFLEGKELTDDEIKRGLKARSLKNEIVLCMCGTAFKNKGVQALLDAVIDFMPSPMELPDTKGIDDRGEPATRKAVDDAPFSALAFKILNDPFVGNLTFFRVYSGVLKTGDQVYVPTKGKRERIGRLLQMHASERTDIKEVRAGDIAAAVGLKDVITGDTLCSERQDHHPREDGDPGARDRRWPSSPGPRPTRKRWAWRCSAWPAKILRSACQHR